MKVPDTSPVMTREYNRVATCVVCWPGLPSPLSLLCSLLWAPRYANEKLSVLLHAASDTAQGMLYRATTCPPAHILTMARPPPPAFLPWPGLVLVLQQHTSPEFLI